jgi:hypothetical protein
VTRCEGEPQKRNSRIDRVPRENSRGFTCVSPFRRFVFAPADFRRRHSRKAERTRSRKRAEIFCPPRGNVSGISLTNSRQCRVRRGVERNREAARRGGKAATRSNDISIGSVDRATRARVRLASQRSGSRARARARARKRDPIDRESDRAMREIGARRGRRGNRG